MGVSPSRSRFLLKLICCIAFGSASTFFFYSNLLQLSYNILWNMSNLVNNQLCNHHLDQLQFCKYYHMSLNYFLRLIKEISFIDHNIVTFYFHGWKKILLVLSRTSLSSNDKTRSQFTSWKLGSIKRSKCLFCAGSVILDWYLSQLIVLLNLILIAAKLSGFT